LHIGDWNEQKIGIGKCKNTMHIGATLVIGVKGDGWANIGALNGGG